MDRFNGTEESIGRQLWVEFFVLNGLYRMGELSSSEVTKEFEKELEKRLGGKFFVSYDDVDSSWLSLAVRGVINEKITPTVSFKYCEVPLLNFVEWVRENTEIKEE